MCWSQAGAVRDADPPDGGLSENDLKSSNSYSQYQVIGLPKCWGTKLLPIGGICMNRPFEVGSELDGQCQAVGIVRTPMTRAGAPEEFVH